MAVTAFAKGICQLDNQFNDGPVAASTVCYRRAIVMRDESGYIKNGATAAGCRGVGVAAYNDGMFGAAGTNPDVWDNGSGSAAAFRVKYETGIWGPFANSGTSITIGMEGRLCYIVDNVTVHKDNGGGTRSPAGRIVEVTSAGVYVDFCEDDVIGTNAMPPMVIPVVLSQLANGANIGRFVPNFSGYIDRMDATAYSPATTAAKAAQLQPAISGNLVSGGILSANSTALATLGNRQAATTITGSNYFTAGQEISLQVSNVTAFVEGLAAVNLYLRA